MSAKESLFEILGNRRSIRAFGSEEVPPETVAEIVTAATWAPTAGNMQAWHFYAVRSEDLRRKLAAAALQQGFIAQAPVVIVVCADLLRARAAYRERGVTLYAIQDAAAAIQNMLLAIHASGLGACWVGAFDEPAVAAALDLPTHRRPLALVPVGRPAEQPRGPGRRPLTEVFAEID